MTMNPDFTLRMTRNGKLRLFYKDEPLPGIIAITAHGDHAVPAKITVEIIGLVVRLETEMLPPISGRAPE